MKQTKKPKNPISAENKLNDPGTDQFVLTSLEKSLGEIRSIDRGIPSQWADIVDNGDFTSDLNSRLRKAHQGLLNCSRASAAAVDPLWDQVIHLASEQLGARTTGDLDLVIKSGQRLLENAARLGFICSKLDQLHETFTGDVMGELLTPKVAAQRVASVTKVIKSLTAPPSVGGKATKSKHSNPLTDCFPALKNRFCNSLGDLQAGYEWLCSQTKLEKRCCIDPAKGGNWFESLNRAIAGGVLATGALCRDFAIYRGMLGDMIKNCTMPWTESLEDAYQWITPSPTGDGKTKKTAFQFHHARNKFEAVGMAHEFLGSLLDGSHKWCIRSVNESELTEYAETRKGKIWFRYRMDPKILPLETVKMMNELK